MKWFFEHVQASLNEIAASILYPLYCPWKVICMLLCSVCHVSSLDMLSADESIMLMMDTSVISSAKLNTPCVCVCRWAIEDLVIVISVFHWHDIKAEGLLLKKKKINFELMTDLRPNWPLFVVNIKFNNLEVSRKSSNWNDIMLLRVCSEELTK